jgi:hypothetical protein
MRILRILSVEQSEVSVMSRFTGWCMAFCVFLCLGLGSSAHAGKQVHAGVVVTTMSSGWPGSRESLRGLVEDALQRHSIQVVQRVDTGSGWQSDFRKTQAQLVYEVQCLSFGGQLMLRVKEHNMRPHRVHASRSVAVRRFRDVPQKIEALLGSILRDANHARSKHSSFRWGLGVMGGMALGFDERPDKPVFFPGGLVGGALRFSFDVGAFRIDLESAMSVGPENYHLEIVALRAVYHPFLVNMSPYIGFGVSFIAQPTMIDGSGPPMFGVGVSLNAGYELFRLGRVQLLMELQIHFPFLNQCGQENVDDNHTHDHENHTNEEFDIWVPSAHLKLILMW